MRVVGLDSTQDGFGGGMGRPEGRIVEREVSEEDAEEEGGGCIGGGEALVSGFMVDQEG